MRNVFDEVEFLLRHEFPGSRAPPPITTLDQAIRGSGPDHNANSAHVARTTAITARREELLRMPVAARKKLIIAAEKRWRKEDRKRRKESTPPIVRPDASYWQRLREWKLSVACTLAVNLEPRKGLGFLFQQELLAVGSRCNGDHVKQINVMTDWRGALSQQALDLLELATEIHENARAANRANDLAIASNGTVVPKDFAAFVVDASYPWPVGLRPLLKGRPTASALAEQNELLTERVKDLEEQLRRGLDPESETYPRELDIAFLAWRAATNGLSGKGTIKQKIEAWLRKNYPKLILEEVKRIATVANYSKNRGRKRT